MWSDTSWLTCFYNSLKAPPPRLLVHRELRAAEEESLKAAVMSAHVFVLVLLKVISTNSALRFSRPQKRAEDFSLCFRWSWIRPPFVPSPHAVVHTILLSHRLAQRANYSPTFFPLPLPSTHSFYSWLGWEGAGGREGGGCLLLCAAPLVINLSSFITTCPLFPAACR